jgi:hypothetical protein
VNTNLNTRTHPITNRRRAAVVAAALLATTGLAATACSGTIVHNYRTFESALDRGASCAELYDQRSRFENEDTLAKIDRDLLRIGCTSPNATRNR